nr:MAG TPA: hypothetical protein [Caudoviricetes sp.]
MYGILAGTESRLQFLYSSSKFHHSVIDFRLIAQARISGCSLPADSGFIRSEKASAVSNSCFSCSWL